MKPKETNARIIIDKMLLEAEWKLPGYVKDHEINVETEIINEFGEADYVLLSTKENHLRDAMTSHASSINSTVCTINTTRYRYRIPI